MAEDKERGIGDITLRVTTGGHRYDMQIGDFSATDEMAFKETTGEDLMTPFVEGKVNAILIAGLIWLYRRRFEKNLRFKKVADSFTFADLDSIEFVGPDDDDGDEDDDKPATLTTEVPDPEP